MKATKRQLKKEAERHGAKLDFDSIGLETETTCEAPEGHHFAGNGVHSVVVGGGYIPRRWQQYAVILEDMKDGFTRCTKETCNLSHDETGCEWWPQEEVE